MITGELEGGRMADAAASQPPSAEEVALKRNTDCVYFLASPLTCKKGSDCEYRHSDFARVNPRDCWFWLNGNCLNPKCGFRHPPLDGLLGTQMPTPDGSAQPLLQSVTTFPVQVVDANSNQGVPCKFFQSGYCLKGDWCSFLHIPNSMKNRASVVPVKASATESSNINKVETSIPGKNVPPTSKGKPIKGSLDQQVAAGEVKPDVHINELYRDKRISNTSCINDLPDHINHPVSNGNMVNQFINVQQPHEVDDPGMIDDKSAGDVSREPSPGFDVLVDDEGRDSEFYHSEDQYGMSREYEGRNEYDIDHLTDYNMVAEADNDRYRYLHGYDSEQYPKGHYSSERSRASCERMSAGSYLKKRPYDMAELDLRHHLTRNKQPRGLRSVISHENKHANGHSHGGVQRHERHTPRRENSLSNRLQGRIRLPRRSSSPIGREMTRRSDYGTYSARECHPSIQRRIQDRIKGRVEGASINGWKHDKGLHSRRDTSGDHNDDFDGPKSLAELKNRKNAEPHHVMDQQQLGKRKYVVPDALQQNGSLLSFEGPRPLEEILKRKRGETTGTVSQRNSSSGEDVVEDNNQKEGNNESVSSLAKKEANFFASIERNVAEQHYNGSEPVSCKVKAEDSTVAESRVDGEFEASYEEREGFNSEVDGAADFGVYDGEEEYLDVDGDDDEFAKKLGVVY